MILAGYLVFNYPFMQLGSPGRFRLPLGELVLIVVLLSTDVPRVLLRMNATVFLFPFLVWWSWGLGRFVLDTVDQGFWALRDSTQLIESLFLIAGFTLAGQPRMTARLVRCCAYHNHLLSLLTAVARKRTSEIADAAWRVEQAIPIFAAFATTGTMLLWG